MGYSFTERLVMVLTHSWKAQLAAFAMLTVTLGTFLLMKAVNHALAGSAFISEVAETASFFHAEWVASAVVLFAMWLAFNEIVQREWRKLNKF